MFGLTKISKYRPSVLFNLIDASPCKSFRETNMIDWEALVTESNLL